MRFIIMLISIFFLAAPTASFSAGQPRIYARTAYEESIITVTWLIETEDRVILRENQVGDGGQLSETSQIYRIVSSSMNRLTLELVLDAKKKKITDLDFMRKENGQLLPPLEDYALTLKDFAPVRRQNIIRAKRLPNGNLFFSEGHMAGEYDYTVYFPEGSFVPLEQRHEKEAFTRIGGDRTLHPLQAASALLEFDMNRIQKPEKQVDFRFLHWGDRRGDVIRKESYCDSVYLGSSNNNDYIYYSYFDKIVNKQVVLEYTFKSGLLVHAEISLRDGELEEDDEFINSLRNYFQNLDTGNSTVEKLRKKINPANPSEADIFCINRTAIVINRYPSAVSAEFSPIEDLIRNNKKYQDLLETR